MSSTQDQVRVIITTKRQPLFFGGIRKMSSESVTVVLFVTRDTKVSLQNWNACWEQGFQINVQVSWQLSVIMTANTVVYQKINSLRG